MFEFIFGVVAVTILIVMALYDSKLDHSERYDLSDSEVQPLLGVVYPDENPALNDKKDKNA